CSTTSTTRRAGTTGSQDALSGDSASWRACSSRNRSSRCARNGGSGGDGPSHRPIADTPRTPRAFSRVRHRWSRGAHRSKASLTPLQRGAIPPAALCRGGVGRPAEVEQHLFRIFRAAEVVIVKIEAAEGLVVIRGGGSYGHGAKPLRFRCRIAVEGCPRQTAVAGPEAGAAHLVRIGFTRDRIGVFALRSAAAGEARHRQIETAPEEMHRAALADELSAKRAEYVV